MTALGSHLQRPSIRANKKWGLASMVCALPLEERRGMESTVLVVAGAVVATAMATGIAVVRVVPAGHCGVVIRAGRATRLRRSGLVMVAPGIERIEMVALRPPPIDPLG